MSYTVTQMARAVKKSAGTIRTWTAEFADYLSPLATVGRGEIRTYSDEDLAVFKTVSVLRDQQQTYDVIRRQLQAGERLEPLEPGQATGKPQEPAVAAVAGSSDLVAADMLERFIVRYESRIDYLESQIEAEREARLVAEREAADAKAEVRVLREVQSVRQVEQEATGKGEGQRRRWRWPWQRISKGVLND